MSNDHKQGVKRNSSNAIPWSLWMQIGIGHLKLAPEDFWALTLKEFKVITSSLTGQVNLAPMEPKDLADLMGEFPDNATNIK